MPGYSVVAKMVTDDSSVRHGLLGSHTWQYMGWCAEEDLPADGPTSTTSVVKSTTSVVEITEVCEHHRPMNCFASDHKVNRRLILRVLVGRSSMPS